MGSRFQETVKEERSRIIQKDSLFSGDPRTYRPGTIAVFAGAGASANPQAQLGRAALTFVVILFLDVPRQAEVPQLHTLRGGHQDVPDGDVPGRRI